ncbi:MAG: hypothetical protein ACKVQA_17595 [Burkholderiales bacterium]
MGNPRDVPADIMFNTIGRKTAVSEVRAARQETILVPAGRFSAWRIETLSGVLAGNTVVECTFWYTPEMARTVKMNLKIQSVYISLRTDETYELMSYQQGSKTK